MSAATLFVVLCGVQGVYYLITGAWPLVSMRTFLAVTGPKTDNWTGRLADHWLVKTAGVLITSIGIGLLAAAAHGHPSPEVVALACAAIVALTSIDVIYVARRVIPPIYLADAAVEVVLLAAWVVFVAVWRGGS